MGKEEKIRVFVCDDHQVFTDGLKLHFQLPDNPMQFMGCAKDEKECLAMTKNRPLDIILMDIKISDDPKAGIHIVKKLQERFKGDDTDPHVIFLTGFYDKSLINEAVDLNCSFLAKDLRMNQIIDAIIDVYRKGKSVFIFPLSIADSPENEYKQELISTLTLKELLVAIFLYEHGSNERIAKKLEIAVATVNTHLKNIYYKLDLNKRKNNREILIKKVEKSGLANHIDEIDEDGKAWYLKVKK